MNENQLKHLKKDIIWLYKSYSQYTDIYNKYITNKMVLPIDISEASELYKKMESITDELQSIQLLPQDQI